MSIFYRPDASVAADFIPFFWNGEYHLFYLRDWRNHQGHGEGTPWFHLVTRDFVHFEDWGEALPRGTKEEQDLYVFTGSAYHADGQFHIFYTGHNHHLKQAGKPVQAILHATSPDLRTWTKEAGWAMYAPAELGYEPDDWRDPFVLDHRASEHPHVLFTRCAARQRLAPILEMHKIARHQVEPGRALAVAGRIAIVLEVE